MPQYEITINAFIEAKDFQEAEEMYRNLDYFVDGHEIICLDTNETIPDEILWS